MPMTKFEDKCPHCGSHLIIKEGRNGEFFACPRFPLCKFTKPLPDKDSDIRFYHPPNPYCKKCNHTGLIPFTNKNGEVVPHSFLYCECNDSVAKEYPYQRTPEMFDFPCSYTWRAYYEGTEYGEHLPPLDPPENELQPQIDRLKDSINELQLAHTPMPADRMSKQELYGLKHLVNKLMERVNNLQRQKGEY